MADTLDFALILPERVVLSESVLSIVVAGEEGDMTLLPRHMPIVSTLLPGIVVVGCADGAEKRFFVDGGVVSGASGRVNILTEMAFDLDDTQAVPFIEGEIASAESTWSDPEISGEDRDRMGFRLSRLREVLGAVRSVH